MNFSEFTFISATFRGFPLDLTQIDSDLTQIDSDSSSRLDYVRVISTPIIIICVTPNGHKKTRMMGIPFIHSFL